MLNTISETLPSSLTDAGVKASALFGASSAYLVGDENVFLLKALLVFMAIDIVLGNWNAFRRRTWQSSTSRHGTQKKVLSLLVIGLAHLLDIVFASILGAQIILPATISMYCLGEFGSIIENLGLLGFGDVVPEPVARLIERLRHRVDYEVDRIAEPSAAGSSPRMAKKSEELDGTGGGDIGPGPE